MSKLVTYLLLAAFAYGPIVVQSGSNVKRLLLIACGCYRTDHGNGYKRDYLNCMEIYSDGSAEQPVMPNYPTDLMGSACNNAAVGRESMLSLKQDAYLKRGITTNVTMKTIDCYCYRSKIYSYINLLNCEVKLSNGEHKMLGYPLQVLDFYTENKCSGIAKKIERGIKAHLSTN
ncbi:MAG: hypothetical protein ISR65_03430 [Bacteriovoracaceae bacterium]|nr:hypothetical protein [Bacteriovoracaceae bacterium]